jgi:hypothetical protein
MERIGTCDTKIEEGVDGVQKFGSDEERDTIGREWRGTNR